MSKNKLQNLKEKYRIVEFQTTISVDKKTKFNFVSTLHGYVKAIDEDGNEHILNPAQLTEYYTKNNGTEKILSKSVINEDKKNFDIDGNLLEYDYILAVDTSYELISSVKKAFTAFTLIETTLLKANCTELNNPFDVYTFEWDATGIDKPENLMYANRIDALSNYLSQNSLFNKKVAIIVDSDLENIPSFNKQQLPIFDSYILPNDFHIFYASTDSGNCIQNAILRACDNEAKKALYKFKNKK